jgi:ubiquinone/menaquinone biosynthesis C-methylase UbiE
MEHQHSEEELKNIAKQLSCPEGEHGIKTGEMMHASNLGMTSSAIDALNLQNNNTILEIGHGNGGHIAQLLSKAENLKYYGADISETIIAEAKKNTAEFINQVSFQLTNGNAFSFSDKQFDKIFTVNTIYFWNNPLEYLKEVKRILVDEGLFVLCFADKTYLEKRPYIKYGFKLYDDYEATELLRKAGFTNIKTIKKTEQINNTSGFMADRDYYIISAIA